MFDMSETSREDRKVKKEYIITRQGKDFVLYEGLLDEAHQQGLKRISTTLIQIPHQDNGQMAVVQAEVETDRGSFMGIGDASPQNVNRMILPHLLRMAECVPLQARILTRDGFKYHDEVRTGEEVLAYDVERDLSVWTPLEDVRVYREQFETLSLSSRSFYAVCTPDHSWAVRRSGKRVRANPRMLRKTCEFTTSDSIIVAAPAEGGDSPLTAREAALLGWLATDGTVREQTVQYAGRPYGPYTRAYISQSKPQYLDELRVLVGPDGSEQVSAARRRDFGTYVSQCLPQHKFELTAKFARELLEKAGMEDWSDLPRLVPYLTQPARAAMLDAMLKGDGALRRGHSWNFGQKAKPGIMPAFELLATLEGYALGKPRMSSVGEVPVRQLRCNRLVNTNYLAVTPGEPQPVWCPTTRYGTWIMNLDGCISITGNTRAKARALRDAVNVGVTAVEELGDFDEPADEESDDTPAADSQSSAARESREPYRSEFPKASPYKPASANQLATIAKLSRLLGQAEKPDEDMTSADASERITELSRQYNERKGNPDRTPARRSA